MDFLNVIGADLGTQKDTQDSTPRTQLKTLSTEETPTTDTTNSQNHGSQNINLVPTRNTARQALTLDGNVSESVKNKTNNTLSKVESDSDVDADLIFDPTQPESLGEDGNNNMFDYGTSVKTCKSESQKQNQAPLIKSTKIVHDISDSTSKFAATGRENKDSDPECIPDLLDSGLELDEDITHGKWIL